MARGKSKTLFCRIGTLNRGWELALSASTSETGESSEDSSNSLLLPITSDRSTNKTNLPNRALWSTQPLLYYHFSISSFPLISSPSRARGERGKQLLLTSRAIPAADGQGVASPLTPPGHPRFAKCAPSPILPWFSVIGHFLSLTSLFSLRHHYSALYMITAGWFLTGSVSICMFWSPFHNLCKKRWEFSHSGCQ